MSLRVLADRIAAGGAASADAATPTGTALCFVFNRDFLWPFKVLVYTLIRQQTVLDVPVLLISEDETLRDDPLIGEVVDQFVVADKSRIAEFSAVSGERVRDILRLDWIAKYTFLKWLLFDDHGYERLVYIDADILCLNPIDELATLRGADLYGAPVFKKHLFETEDGARLELGERERNIEAFVDAGNWDSLNSGVMVVNQRCLSADFRSRLIELAVNRKTPFSVEQAAVREFFRQNADFSFAGISPLFNYGRGVLDVLPVESQLATLGRIKLLHYPGARAKPWSGSTGYSWSLTRTFWHAYARQAADTDQVFAAERHEASAAADTGVRQKVRKVASAGVKARSEGDKPLDQDRVQRRDLEEFLPGLRIRTVFDVGAHVGRTAAEFRRRHRRAEIWAFEPTIESYQQLQRATADDKRIRTFNLAMGATAESGHLLTRGTSTGNRLVSEGVKGDTQPIEIVRGDDFCRWHKVRSIGYLKIDTEGKDLDVLRGFSGMLEKQRIDLVAVEVGMNFGNTKHVPLAECQSFLEPLGYSIFRFYSQTGEGVRGPHLRRADVVFVSNRIISKHAERPRTPTRDGSTTPAPPPAVIAAEAIPYLRKSGWTRSRDMRRPVDASGHPLPWYTYPTISFLDARVTADMSVFEFGCGNSTLWWADRAAHVTAVEHHRKWVEIISGQLPENAELMHRPLEADGEYSRAVAGAPGAPFHVAVIDGRDRVNCARHSLAALRDDGVIVWDNSNRERYETGFAELKTAGFRRLDFWGHGPVNAREWLTTVFYRPGNCLGI